MKHLLGTRSGLMAEPNEDDKPSEIKWQGLFTRNIQDVVTTPQGHDSKQELGSEFGIVKDWSKGEIEGIPGKQCPTLPL